jgi:diguanylate cyclase (GGDEF)-like protein
VSRNRESTNTIKVDPGAAPEQTPDERRPVLVVLHGSEIGRTFGLGGERVVLGRALDSDLVLRDDATSRRHAAVFPLAAEGGRAYAIEDLGSTNGTLLNGAPVKEACALRDGDKIQVGGHLLKFAWLDAWEVAFQERLHHMTQRDELTGLRSRRSLFAEIERELARAPRPLAVLMLDLDHFRRVNDAHGHLVGSQTVRAVGRLIHEGMGEQADRAARYGGEEYLVWTEGGRAAGAALAERLRAAIEAAHLDSRPGGSDGALRVTTSVGVAAHPEDGADALDLVQKADLALFRAKRTGRNRVCAYDPELDRPDATRREVELRRIVDGPAEAQ